jgi:hypothetical protein
MAIEPAKRDIFAPVELPLPKAGPSQPKLAPPVQTATPLPMVAPPQAPPLTYQFWGRMVTPTGQRLTYLARGEIILPVSVGDRLEEGYVVEAVSDDGVQLLYPPLNQRVTVPIAPPRVD